VLGGDAAESLLGVLAAAADPHAGLLAAVEGRCARRVPTTA